MGKKVNKWIPSEYRYVEIELPAEWNVIVSSDDMEVMANCAQCGKLMTFGECYTSLELHTNEGWGYAVCEDCYTEEIERREKGWREK